MFLKLLNRSFYQTASQYNCLHIALETYLVPLYCFVVQLPKLIFDSVHFYRRTLIEDGQIYWWIRWVAGKSICPGQVAIIEVLFLAAQDVLQKQSWCTDCISRKVQKGMYSMYVIF
jgi:hypothetical protein